jgi:hypothetical protein
LTLYAHDIQEYSNIARLFDVFLAMDPVFPLYLFAEVRLLVSQNQYEFVLTQAIDCLTKKGRAICNP